MRHAFAAGAIVLLSLTSSCSTAPPVPAPSPEVVAVRSAASERDAWGIAKSSRDDAVLQEFLARFPEGDFRSEAELRLKLLQKGLLR